MTRMNKVGGGWRSMGLLGVSMMMLVGCGAEPVEPVEEELLGTTDEGSFEDFLATVTREKDTGVYIVEGDMAVPSLEQLRQFWESRPKPGALIVNRVNGVDTVWSGSQKLRLTYCVSKSGFGSSYAMVVQAMEQATNAWENVAAVDFQHLSAHDGSCTAFNNNVVFSVEYTSGKPYTALAFLPNYARADRRLMIDLYNATHAAPKTLTGVLRHELGHALGFRHEHTRPEANDNCYEDSNWRALTPYDRASVMHYPPYSSDCGGTNNGDYVLTQFDRQGASSLYGATNRKNFNADLHTDVLWYHPVSGQLSAWLMNGTTVTRDSYLSWTAASSTGWDVKGTGDFNRDGQTDVLWYHPASGQLSVWYLNGTTVTGNASLSWTVPGSAGWDIKGTGDFNRDGHIDVLWHHPASGQLSVWYLNGTTVAGSAYLSWTVPGSTGWDVKGTGDFNRDGNVDVLWHHTGSGDVSVWYMSGATVLSNAYLSWNVPGYTGWKIVSR